MSDRALNRRTFLELAAILLVAVGGVVLSLQQQRTGEALDELNRTVLGTQVLRCKNDLTDQTMLDPAVRAICRRAMSAAGGMP